MRHLLFTIESLIKVTGLLSGWLVFLMMVLVLFEVFMRYVLNQPPMIADEFSAYMLVAISLLGLAYTWKERGHIRISILVKRLPPRVSSWLRLTGLVLAFVFTSELTRASYSFIALSFKLHIHSATWLHFPLQGPQMTIPIGFGLLSLMLLLAIVKAIKNIRAGVSIELTAEEKV